MNPPEAQAKSATRALVLDCDRQSDTLFIAFSGHALQGAEVPEFEFRRAAGSIEANTVFVRDLDFAWYQRGIDGIGNIEESVRYLQELAGRLGARQVVTIGNSGGGFAAILFGVLMGAQATLGFSAQTRILDRGDTRFPEALARVSALSRKMRTYPDLAELLRVQTGATKVVLYYGSHNPMDRTHAERLRGLPGVSLLPFPTRHHGCGRILARRGLLTRILDLAARGEVPDVSREFPRGLRARLRITAERLRLR